MTFSRSNLFGKLSISLIVLLSNLSTAYAQNTSRDGLFLDPHPTTVQPKGEYAQIDVKSGNQTTLMLLKGIQKQQNEALTMVLAHSEHYMPPVLFAVSKVLFDEHKVNEAVFWFYAAALRGIYDTNRCMDESAKSAFFAVANIGHDTFQYAKAHPDLVKTTIPKVLAWNENTAYEYDYRWVNLHGLKCLIEAQGGPKNDAPLTAPKNDWKSIADKSRAQFLKSFMPK
jgi:hypothetical protein